MNVSHKYSSESMCINNGNESTLGLSCDLSRDEKVSFDGLLKKPLLFRDSMLMLRDIVTLDMRVEKKDRTQFFNWLQNHIEQKAKAKEEHMEFVRGNINKEQEIQINKLNQKLKEISTLSKKRDSLEKQINKTDIWKDYYKIEKDFWNFIYKRDIDLWMVLDPVITVHPDMVSFEAFSLDESCYGCLSVDIDEFELLKEPKLGTTNIDFSQKLATEMKRFRTYNDVRLNVSTDGFSVDSNVMPTYLEKKIDLPETWIQGFNQVSCASFLDGLEIELSNVDIYDLCSFLKKNKAKKSPRYMKWILEPQKHIRILLEPFGKELVLKTKYNGKKKREEKIWGRRRWLVLDKLIPFAKSFKIKLLGFSMPQFIVCDLGNMKMTIGFSSWSSNDWVKGTAFNIMSGFIGDGCYKEVYKLLKNKRYINVNDIYNDLNTHSKEDINAGIGLMFKKGEAYFDIVKNVIRFRKLCSFDIDKKLYETTNLELNVKKHLDIGMNNFSLIQNENNEIEFKNKFRHKNPHYKSYNYRNTDTYNKEFILKESKIKIDGDGQIIEIDCNCSHFYKSKKNISDPCEHILSLYLMSSKFLKLDYEINKEYKINDIMEMLLC